MPRPYVAADVGAGHARLPTDARQILETNRLSRGPIFVHPTGIGSVSLHLTTHGRERTLSPSAPATISTCLARL